MSIASEVTRLQNAKANLKTAIEAKGVDVADTDTIDTYASKVEAIQAGGGSYYDTFWDNYQQNGERTDQTAAFAGKGWTVKTFRPKRDIKIGKALYMFYSSYIEGDLTEILTELGIELVNNGCVDFTKMFSYSLFTRLGELDLTTIALHLFGGFCDNMPNLTRIEKIKTKQRFFDEFDEAIFRNSSKLAYIRFEGGLFTKNTSFKTLPLDAGTAKHIIGLLTNYAGTDKEFSFIITFSPTTWGYLDAEGETASPNGNSWREYINDLGWNAS